MARWLNIMKTNYETSPRPLVGMCWWKCVEWQQYYKNNTLLRATVHLSGHKTLI